jgi:beta-lactamase regulating signal transducer with metallopeptidase domain
MVGFAIRGTAVLLLWLVAWQVLRGTSAYNRRFAHALAVAALLLLPALTPLLPSLPVACLPPEPPVAAPTPTPTRPQRIVNQLPSAVAAVGRALPEVAATRHASPDLVLALPAAFWLVGAGLLGFQLTLGLTRLCHVLRRSSPVRDCSATLLRARIALSVRRRVIVRYGAVSSPMTAGLLRHFIVLPPSAARWEPPRLEAVLRHELAHVRTEDWVLLLLARLVLILYWFHPLAWLLASTLRRDMEAAADDQVVASGLPPSEYATHLTEIAATLH